MNSVLTKSITFAVISFCMSGCRTNSTKKSDQQTAALENLSFLGHISSPLDQENNFSWGVNHSPSLGLLNDAEKEGRFYCDHIDLSRARPIFETVNHPLRCFRSLEELKKPKNHRSAKGALIQCQRKAFIEEVKCSLVKEINFPDSPSESPGSTKIVIQSLEGDGMYYTGKYTALTMSPTSGKALYCPKAKEKDQITCYFSRAEFLSHLNRPLDSFEKSTAREDGPDQDEYLVGTISFCEDTKPAKCKFYGPVRVLSK
jgi:hypothetical protein